jgi:DNA-binding GntR family transcriptional regulator
MNFKKATDDLLSGISHEQLAEALGVSVASVRQARLTEEALAFRRPPKGWEAVIARLARQRAEHYRRLAERLGGR